MFENVAAGWKMGGAIRKLVFQDRKLFVFPAIAALVIIIETILIFLSLFLFGAFNSLLFYVGLFFYYLVVYFTSTFVLVAMLIGFRSFSQKKPISIGAAFSQASGYFVQILEWALFEAVVTMIIRAIEQRLGAVGAMIFGLAASIAISVATAFAIPVIIDKRTGPISTLKESTGFIIHNFGKTFGGLAYAELYSLIFTLSGIAVLIIGFFAIAASPIVGITVAVIGIALLVFGAMLSYLLSNVYRFVLYEYKNGGKLPAGITKDMVDASIKQKRQGGSVLGGGFAGPQQ